jgi:hypothetical protein
LISIESAIPRLKEFIERQFPTLNAPGLAIGLTHREHVLYEGVYGLANRETGKSVTPDPLFQISSISNTKYLPWSEIRSEYEYDLLESGLFRIGKDPRSPECIRFDVIINGKAMQAILSGGVYSRTFILKKTV